VDSLTLSSVLSNLLVACCLTFVWEACDGGLQSYYACCHEIAAGDWLSVMSSGKLETLESRSIPISPPVRVPPSTDVQTAPGPFRT